MQKREEGNGSRGARVRQLCGRVCRKEEQSLASVARDDLKQQGEEVENESDLRNSRVDTKL